MLGLRLVYLYPWKDYENEFRGKSPERLRDYVYQRLETITKEERIWIVIIAGVGFFADAYAIFAINMVVPMLEIVYCEGNMPQYIKVGITIATLGGSMLGQLFFGIAADWLGRRRMYGWELIVTIIATIGVASASSGISGTVPNIGSYFANGTYPSNGNYNATGKYIASGTYIANGVDPWNGSLSIIGSLVAWRFVLGLAIGADYPLSAVICSEFAPKRHRARMLSAVFFFQPLGQLAATLISLIVTAGYGSTLSQYDQAHCYQHPECLKTVDIMWRIIIGVGAVLPAVALGFRLAILESPRYTVDVRKKSVKAAAQLNSMGEEPLMQDHFSSDDVSTESISNGLGVRLTAEEVSGDGSEAGGNPIESGGVEEDLNRQAPINEQHEIAPSNSNVTRTATDRDENRGARPEVFASQKEKTSGRGKVLRADIKRYFWDQGHGWTLFATSLCWFCLDLPYYGLGMNSTSIIGQIWTDEGQRQTNLYPLLLSNTWESLIFVSIGAITGGIITFSSINSIGERNIQMIGFSALFVLFILTGSLLKILMNGGQDQLIVFLYVMCQTFFNFGPNTTTYIIPAEFFPTRYRASSHGISAASGKLGSVIAQAIIYGIYVNKPPYDIQDWLGWTLLGFSPLMLVGLMVTIFLIPSTREDGQPLSLERLAAEYERPQNKLKQIWKWKSKAVVHNVVQDEENRGHVDDPIALEQDGLVVGQPGGSGGNEVDQITGWRDVYDAIERTR